MEINDLKKLREKKRKNLQSGVLLSPNKLPSMEKEIK